MSSTTITLEALNQLITCSICSKRFTTPKTLKCLHTFCEACIDTTIKLSNDNGNQGYRCQQCRSFTGIEDVTNSSYIVQLIDLYRGATSPKKCVHCGKTDVKWKCVDCVEHFCTSCKEGHLKIRALSFHKFQSLNDVTSSLVIDHPVACTKHTSEILRYYCKNCKTLLCCTCALIDHEGHSYETLNDALKKHIPKVEGLVDVVDEIYQLRQERIGLLKNRSGKLQASFNECMQAAEKQKKIAMAKVEDDYKDITRKIKNIKQEEDKKLSAAIMLEESKQNEAVASSMYARNVLRTASGAHAMQEIQQNILTNLTEMTECSMPYLPQTHAPVYNNKTIHPAINHLGDISTQAIITENETNQLGKMAAYLCEMPNPCRFLNIEFALLFSKPLVVNKTIDIAMKKPISVHRISIGFDTIMVCFSGKATILSIYSTDGTHIKTYGKICVTNTRSACFLDETIFALASSTDGLHVLSITKTTPDGTMHRLAGGKYADIQCMDNSLFALRYVNRTILVATKTYGWETSATIRTIHTELGQLGNSATLLVSASRMFLGSFSNTVYELSLDGKILREIKLDDMANAIVCATNNDGDVIVVGGAGHGQCVVSGETQTPFNIPGVHNVKDIVFQDASNLWVLEEINVNNGKYKIRLFKSG